MLIKSQKKIEKPWGYELILMPPDAQVTAKILHLNAGCRFSLQFHEIKEEMLTLIDGEAEIIWGENENELNKEVMEKNYGYFMSKKTIHRVQAISDCDIFESSTPELGTTVRLQDDYARKDETERDRNKNRM